MFIFTKEYKDIIEVRENILHPYSSENTQSRFSVDCVVLTFHDSEIKILLAKKNIIYEYWVLLGGFMFKDEDADKAAWRALKEDTGLTNLYMKHFICSVI